MGRKEQTGHVRDDQPQKQKAGNSRVDALRSFRRTFVHSNLCHSISPGDDSPQCSIRTLACSFHGSTFVVRDTYEDRRLRVPLFSWRKFGKGSGGQFAQTGHQAIRPRIRNPGWKRSPGRIGTGDGAARWPTPQASADVHS
jgi:hypothetical protein